FRDAGPGPLARRRLYSRRLPEHVGRRRQKRIALRALAVTASGSADGFASQRERTLTRKRKGSESALARRESADQLRDQLVFQVDAKRKFLAQVRKIGFEEIGNFEVIATVV